MPIAKPTSAFLRAGASLVPSPVTATTFPLSLSPVTKAYLSSGLDLASTSKLLQILSNYSPFIMVSTRTSYSFIYLSSACFKFIGHGHLASLHFLQTTPPIFSIKSLPYITKLVVSLWEIMPIYSAIALAVIKLSPVTIRTVIPAFLHLFIAYGTSGLGISLTPIIHNKVKSLFSISNTPLLSEDSKSSLSLADLYAKQSVLSDLLAILSMDLFIYSKIPESKLWI